MKYSILLALAVAALGLGRVEALTYTTLDAPGAIGTFALGVSGNTVVGYYYDNNLYVHGFTYSGGVYTILNDPSAAPGNPIGLPYPGTYAYGISGNTVVGTFSDSAGNVHGFSETGGIYTTIDATGATYNGLGSTRVRGISDNTIVGYFLDSGGISHGFSETGGVCTILNAPGSYTQLNGISGSTVVGSCFIGTFSETGGLYTLLSDPSATNEGTLAIGISGSTVVGSFQDWQGYTHGFSETDGIYTTIDISYFTEVSGISDDTIVGRFIDPNSGVWHGFVSTPEPASLSLLALGTATLLVRRRRLPR